MTQLSQVALLTMTTESMDCSPFNGSFPSNSALSSLSSLSSRLLHGTTTVMPLNCKPMKRKPNPNRASVFKSSAIAPCTECGKQFNSWKALFGHMRCHPDRPWRGMNMKQKQKQKQKQNPKLHAQETSNVNWDHITDEVTRAALILMEMSGQSVQKVVDCMRKSCKEEEVAKARIDLDSLLIDAAAKEVEKVEKPLLDLNLAPPVEY